MEAEMILGWQRGDRQLRASGIARRRMEEERAEAFFLCERRRQRRIPKRDARTAAVTS
jgi:pyridoxine/pyridoxamine 5'-phosphate oxidase